MSNLATGAWHAGPVTVILVVQNATEPSDADWDRYLANVEQSLGKNPSATGLAFTDGAAPNLAQRKRVNAVLAGRTPISVVVSDRSLVRGVVTVLRWFNKHTMSFHPLDVRNAMLSAGITGDQVSSLWSSIAALNKELEPRSRTVETAASQLRL